MAQQEQTPYSLDNFKTLSVTRSFPEVSSEDTSMFSLLHQCFQASHVVTHFQKEDVVLQEAAYKA